MTCSTCIHWRPKDAPEMARQHFARCALGPRWRFLPPQHTCRLHQPAPADVATARERWLAGEKT